MRTLSLVLLSMLFLPACAGRLDKSVRAKAASDFSCPADTLSLKEVDAGAWNSGTYEVNGCDRTDTYYSSCFLFGCGTHTRAEIEQRQAEQEAQAAARRQALAEERAAQAAQRNSGGGGNGEGRPAAPAGPTFVSIRLQNLCPEKVLLFHGRDPKFGSGRSDSIGSNTIQSVQGNEGDMLWIVDEQRNGMSSFSLSSNVKELFVTKSCSGFSTSR